MLHKEDGLEFFSLMGMLSMLHVLSIFIFTQGQKHQNVPLTKSKTIIKIRANLLVQKKNQEIVDLSLKS